MQLNFFCAAALAAALSGPAIAGPMTWWVQSSIQATKAGSFLSLDSGQVQQLVVSEGPLSDSGTSFTGNGGVNGTYANFIQANAAPGHLWGVSNASETFTAYQLAPSNTTNAVRFFDTVTLNSASLAIGTLVDVTLKIVMDDDLSAGPTTCCSNAQVNGTFEFGSLNLADQAGLGAHIAHSVSTQTHVQWAVGSTHLIGGFMGMDSTSAPGVNSLSGKSEVKYLDTQFFIDPGPNASVSSASGVPYSESLAVGAPEPSSFALIALGCLLFSVPQLNRRKS